MNKLGMIAAGAVFLVLISSKAHAAADNLIISEVLPNPVGRDTEGEFIEIYNPGDEAIDLSGWQIDDVIGAGSAPFTLGAIMIEPGEARAFYYSETKIRLNNAGDEVNLFDSSGDLISSVAYDKAPEGKSWAYLSDIYQWLKPTANIANYHPLEILNVGINPQFIDFNKSQPICFNAAVSDPDKKLQKIEFTLPSPISEKIKAGECWFYQAGEIASPLSLEVEARAVDEYGLENLASAEIFFYQGATIQLSEIYPDPPADQTEYIELRNLESQPVKLRFYQLDDREGGSKPYTFKDEIIPAQGYLALYQTKTRIRLNNNGDSVRLIAPDGRLIDNFSYLKSQKGKSFSRFEKYGKSSWEWTNLLSPASANQKREYSLALFISEVLPNPQGKDSQGEFIEIYNSGDKAIDLSGWKLNSYTFISGLIAPQEYLAIPYQQTHIALNNQTAWVYLTNPKDEIVSSLHYSHPGKPEDCSYALINGRYFWTNQPTPGEKNSLPPASTDTQYIPNKKESDQQTAISLTEQIASPIKEASTREVVERVSEVITSAQNKLREISQYLIEPLTPQVKAATLTAPLPSLPVDQPFQSSSSWSIIKYTIIFTLFLGIMKLWRFIKLGHKKIQKE